MTDQQRNYDSNSRTSLSEFDGSRSRPNPDSLITIAPLQHLMEMKGPLNTFNSNLLSKVHQSIVKDPQGRFRISQFMKTCNEVSDSTKQKITTVRSTLNQINNQRKESELKLEKLGENLSTPQGTSFDNLLRVQVLQVKNFRERSVYNLYIKLTYNDFTFKTFPQENLEGELKNALYEFFFRDGHKKLRVEAVAIINPKAEEEQIIGGAEIDLSVMKVPSSKECWVALKSNNKFSGEVRLCLDLTSYEAEAIKEDLNNINSQIQCINNELSSFENEVKAIDEFFRAATSLRLSLSFPKQETSGQREFRLSPDNFKNVPREPSDTLSSERRFTLTNSVNSYSRASIDEKRHPQSLAVVNEVENLSREDRSLNRSLANRINHKSYENLHQITSQPKNVSKAIQMISSATKLNYQNKFLNSPGHPLEMRLNNTEQGSLTKDSPSYYATNTPSYRSVERRATEDSSHYINHTPSTSHFEFGSSNKPKILDKENRRQSLERSLDPAPLEERRSRFNNPDINHAAENKAKDDHQKMNLLISQLQKMTEVVAERDREILQLKKQNDFSKVSRDDMEKAKRHIGKLVEENKRLLEVAQNYQKDAMHFKQQIAGLQKERASVNDDVFEKITALKTANSNLSLEVSEKNRRLDYSVEELDTVKKQNQNILSELAKKDETILKLKSEISEQHGVISFLSAQRQIKEKAKPVEKSKFNSQLRTLK